MKFPSVFDCNVINLERILNRAGNITAIQNNHNVPFRMKRIYYLYDVPGGESRGAHSLLTCHQFLVAASGSFEIRLDDGVLQKTVQLNRPFLGLHIPPMIWASETNFSSGTICLVMASELYDAGDYVRDYQEFLSLRRKNKDS